VGKTGKCGGSAYLSHLVSIVPTPLDAKYYAQIVYRLSVMRQLIIAAGQIADIGYRAEPDLHRALNQAEETIFQLRQERETLDFTHIKEILDQYFEPPPQTAGHRIVPHILSGFYGLDELLGGFQRSDLIIVAGRPSMGKTSFALNIARNAAVDQAACVAIFSLEMSCENLVQRLISSEAGVESRRIRLGHNTEQEEEKIMEAQGILSEAPIYIDDSPQQNVMDLATKARRLNAERGVDLIIIDYLQLIQGNGRSENRVQEIGYISRA